MKTVFLKKDYEEVFTVKRAWKRIAWRLVDAQGVDLVQPWFRKKSDLRAFAKTQGWQISEQQA